MIFMKTLSEKKVLVTGGLGYIGAHVARLLHLCGLGVTIIDNIWHNKPNQVEGVEVIKGDVNDHALLERLFALRKFDAVIHMAGFIQVGESTQVPSKYFHNNVINAAHLLDIMLKFGCNYFILSSTAAVFGDPEYLPIDEQHPKKPLNPYGRYKWMLEELLEDYHQAYGLHFGALRYFNAAGCDPESKIGELHEPETHLIPLMLQVANGRRDFIPIFGTDYSTPDGTCIRDYIHVSDLSEAHLLLLKYLWNGGTEKFFNLGTNVGYSVKQVIAAGEKITGRKINTMLYPRREGDSPILIADGTKAKNILNWQPKLSDLETILSHAWLWEQNLLFPSPGAPARGEGKILSLVNESNMLSS